MPSAFSELIAAQFDPLYRTALRLTGNVSDAEDLVAGDQKIGLQIEAVLKNAPNTASAFAEPSPAATTSTSKSIARRIARHGLSVADVEAVIETAIGRT